jgi:hypothetical protein
MSDLNQEKKNQLMLAEQVIKQIKEKADKIKNVNASQYDIAMNAATELEGIKTYVENYVYENTGDNSKELEEQLKILGDGIDAGIKAAAAAKNYVPVVVSPDEGSADPPPADTPASTGDYTVEEVNVSDDRNADKVFKVEKNGGSEQYLVFKKNDKTDVTKLFVLTGGQKNSKSQKRGGKKQRQTKRKMGGRRRSNRRR